MGTLYGKGSVMATAARIRANTKYAKKAYDQLKIAVPKGYREQVQQAAAEAGESMTQYIKTAIESRMKG